MSGTITWTKKTTNAANTASATPFIDLARDYPLMRFHSFPNPSTVSVRPAVTLKQFCGRGVKGVRSLRCAAGPAAWRCWRRCAAPRVRGGRRRLLAQTQEVKTQPAGIELRAFVFVRRTGRPRPERSRCLIDWSTNPRWVLQVVEVCPTSALADHSRPCARRVGTLPVEHVECR
jgi:hypothetical protein